MSLAWHPIGRIKYEVRKERVGWLVGGYLTWQLKSLALIVPGLVAIILMPDNAAKVAVVGLSFGMWLAWNLSALAVGIFYISRWADREYDRKGRRRLSKEYRKR